MSKKAIYYDEAKRLYVTQGYALTTIEDMLEGKVTRRTLQNWKTDGDWDAKRKRYLEEHESLDEMLREIAKTVFKNALKNPSPKNMLSVIRAIAALKENDAIELLSGKGKEDEKGSEQDIKEAVTEAIKDIMGA